MTFGRCFNSVICIWLVAIASNYTTSVIAQTPTSGVPSIEDLEKQLEQKKAEKSRAERPKSGKVQGNASGNAAGHPGTTTMPTSAVTGSPPPFVARTSPRVDPKHPLKIGEDYYPDASKRANEEGRCIVNVTIEADGIISNATLQQSSGFPRLDDACLKAVMGQRMIPATENGKPVATTVGMPIVWKLFALEPAPAPAPNPAN
jgi:periplasmic protein TonB